MGYINLLSACFVSFPEDFLLLIVSLLIVGRRDILNFRIKTNLFKLLVSALLMTVVTVLLKNLFGQSATVIALVIFVVIYALILRVHWIEAAAGILITSICFMVLEYVCVLIGSQLIGIPFDGKTINDRLRIFLSIAPRVLDIILGIVVYKFNITVINIKTIKEVTKKIKRELALIYIFQACGIFVIVTMIKIDFNALTLSGILKTAIRIVLLVGYIAGNLIITTKLMRRTTEGERNNIITKLWIKQQLSKPNVDLNKILETIDEALKNDTKSFEKYE